MQTNYVLPKELLNEMQIVFESMQVSMKSPSSDPITCLKLKMEAINQLQEKKRQEKLESISSLFSNNTETVKQTIKFYGIAKINVDHPQDSNGNTPLMLAASKGRGEIVDLLVEARSDVNFISHSGNSAIHYCAGNSKMLAKLIELKANVLHKNNSQKTALMIAASQGKIECVSLLISAKASLDDKDDYDNTALMWALEHANYSRNTECADVLLEAGAKTNLNLTNILQALKEVAKVEAAEKKKTSPISIFKKPPPTIAALETSSQEDQNKFKPS